MFDFGEIGVTVEFQSQTSSVARHRVCKKVEEKDVEEAA